MSERQSLSLARTLNRGPSNQNRACNEERIHTTEECQNRERDPNEADDYI